MTDEATSASMTPAQLAVADRKIVAAREIFHSLRIQIRELLAAEVDLDPLTLDGQMHFAIVEALRRVSNPMAHGPGAAENMIANILAQAIIWSVREGNQEAGAT